MSGCPEGMYPLDSNYEDNRYDTFGELKEHAEGVSDSLNLPLSWYFDNEKPGDFKLDFYMPRKGKVFTISASNVDAQEVQAWLDVWIPQQMGAWFGWGDKVLIDREQLRAVVSMTWSSLKTQIKPALDYLRKAGLLDEDFKP